MTPSKTRTPKEDLARLVVGLAALGAATCVGEQSAYRTPPDDVVRIVDASPPPYHLISPTDDALLLGQNEAMPPISLVARPFHRLGGIRVDALSGNRRRNGRTISLAVLHFDDPKPLNVDMPQGSTVGNPVWSPTGKQFAFEGYNGDEIELWHGPDLIDSAPDHPRTQCDGRYKIAE